jgi:hypothetical protein
LAPVRKYSPFSVCTTTWATRRVSITSTGVPVCGGETSVTGRKALPQRRVVQLLLAGELEGQHAGHHQAEDAQHPEEGPLVERRAVSVMTLAHSSTRSMPPALAART